MPAAVPALPGLTKYTDWAFVPDGLYTKTQLAERGLKPGSEPVGQVLYHGNSYAPLYELDAAVAKRASTSAQREALDRARRLQYECRRCGVVSRQPLGAGRWCAPCGVAAELYGAHVQAQEHAREIVNDPAAALVVIGAGPGENTQPVSVAVYQFHDEHLRYSMPAGEYGSPERSAILERLDVILDGRRIVQETDRGPASRYPDMLVTPPGELVSSQRDGLHSWLLPYRKSVGQADYVSRVWRQWFGWTGNEESSMAAEPWNRERGVWVAWERTDHAAADVLDLAKLLHRIADGTEPVWEGARWLVDGHGVPELPQRR